MAQTMVTATITEITDAGNRSFALLDIDDKGMQSRISSTVASTPGVQSYVQRDGSGVPTGPVLIPKRSGKAMRHENFGRDLGIGTGLCLAGCLFVQLAGEEIQEGQKPDGFYATAGTKAVTGGLACVPAAMWAAGCVFLGMGAIEIFLPKDRSYEELETPKQKSSSEGSTSGLENRSPGKKANCFVRRSSGEIIASNGFKVVNRFEKRVPDNDFVSLENWVKRYCLSL